MNPHITPERRRLIESLKDIDRQEYASRLRAWLLSDRTEAEPDRGVLSVIGARPVREAVCRGLGLCPDCFAPTYLTTATSYIDTPLRRLEVEWALLDCTVGCGWADSSASEKAERAAVRGAS